MTTCQVARRKRAREIADFLAQLPDVLDATVSQPGDGAHPDRWTVDLAIDADAVPATVGLVASRRGCPTLEAGPRSPAQYRAVFGLPSET